MANLCPMSDGNGKRERPASNAEEAATLVELELMRKRAAWQRVRVKRKTLLTWSLIFLFAVLAVAVFAFYLFISSGQMNDLRASAKAHSSPSPT